MQAELAGLAQGPSFAELTARMELDFELARARAAPAALLRVEVERLGRFDAGRRKRVLAALGARLAELAPPAGLVAACDGAEVSVLLHDAGIERAEELARTWIASARKLAVEGEHEPVRASLAIGVAATRPGLDAWFDTLRAVANDGLDVARANGGECCVHSELYELHQRRVERTKGPRAPVPEQKAEQVEQGRAAAHTRATAPAAATPARPTAPAPSSAARAQPPPAEALPGLDLAAIEAKVLELAKAAFQREIEQRERRFRDELELYERRIAKMQMALVETESEKARLAKAAGVDAGMASIYRDVQGLTGNEQDFERKDGLLRAIAESNLVLREELRRKRA